MTYLRHQTDEPMILRQLGFMLALLNTHIYYETCTGATVSRTEYVLTSEYMHTNLHSWL